MKIQFIVLLFVCLALVACNAPVPTAAPTFAPTRMASQSLDVTTPTAIAQPTNQPTIKPANTPTAQTTKPNIIFILTDDLDAASIPFMPKLKTLAEQGVTLTNFFINMPLCCPSRTEILRGQYAHNTQILGNTLPSGGFQKFFQLDEEKSTIATWMQSAGYRTLFAGKYLNGFPDRSNLMYIPPGWTEWNSAIKGNAYGEYDYTLNENGKQVVYGKKPEDYGTDVYARKAVDFITRTAKEGKPFFVYLTPYAPHGPATPAPRHEKMFLDVTVPRPPNFNEDDVSDKPAYIRNRPKLTERQITQLTQDYRKRLQSLQAVDDMIESLVNTLKQTGQLDNTYIFFTSDNGFHLGNHRQQTGKVAPYEEEIRVTLIVRGPGVPAGKSLDYLSGNIDLAPTWAELGGASVPNFVDGRSLVSLWSNNPPREWRQCFLIENGLITPQIQTRAARQVPNTPPELLEPPDADDEDAETDATPTGQRVPLGVPVYRGIRMNEYSYVEYVTGEKELYNLKSDPYQLQNLAAKADANLLTQLAARLKQMTTCTGATCRSIENAMFTK